MGYDIRRRGSEGAFIFGGLCILFLQSLHFYLARHPTVRVARLCEETRMALTTK